MKSLKKATQVLFALLLATIVASNGYFYYQVFKDRKTEKSLGFALTDSLRAIQQKRLQFQDSLTFYDHQHEILSVKKDSVNRLDSLQWADLRTSYRTSVRDRVAAKLRERAAR